MKKSVFLFLIASVLVVDARAESSSMALVSISGSPGQTVELPLIFKSGQPQIESMSFDLVLPVEMAFVQASISREAQEKYKQLRVEPNKEGAHITIESWATHPYYKGALLSDGEIIRFIIAIPSDRNMSGRAMVEGPRTVQIKNVQAISPDGIETGFVTESGTIMVLQ